MAGSGRLHRRLDAIDALRRGIVADILALPPGHAEAHPIAGKWSIAEIVEHLVLAEEAAVNAVRQGRSPGRVHFKHRLRYPLVMAILRFDIPVRVPDPAMEPADAADLAAALRRWDASQAALRAWVEGLRPEDLGRPVLRHPVAGPMTAAQGLAMLEVHLARHIRQIRNRMRRMRPRPDTHAPS